MLHFESVLSEKVQWDPFDGASLVVFECFFKDSWIFLSVLSILPKGLGVHGRGFKYVADYVDFKWDS